MKGTIFTRMLSELGVRHTADYSDERFETMPFKTLFGLKKLCEEYKIPTQALRLSVPADMSQLDPPFMAHTSSGMVIVRDFGAERVVYDTQGVEESIDRRAFEKASDGVVFLMFPQSDSIEPDYGRHFLSLLIDRGKRVVMWVLLILICAWLIARGGLWRSPWALAVILLDVAGIFFSTLLVQKGMKIHNPTADKVCGVIEQGGCDTVLETKASSFFGIFNWSEVGLTYFGVSLATLLIFPQHAPWLAALNLCCLPFSLWSVWYQKFRAKAWCTMCLSVQAILWLSFGCYWAGGFVQNIFPLTLPFFVLIGVYATVLLLMNRILAFFK